MQTEVVKQQLELLRFRNSHPSFEGQLRVEQSNMSQLIFKWNNKEVWAQLDVQLNNCEFEITYGDSFSQQSLNF